MNKDDFQFADIWIPGEVGRVMLTEKCSRSELCIYAIVRTLEDSGKPCDVTNVQIAEWLTITTRQVSRSIQSLRKMGVLSVSYDGKSRTLKSSVPGNSSVALEGSNG